ncbi:sugar transferase [Streptomyces sp. CC224B]|uniref:sugar transferase n=1 Tax=Streptomyces sp. CC224B TaxID=3044571 RepID=UPI0024A96538|nr:sugar transferase [Streptomyces sp. CC224B]
MSAERTVATSSEELRQGQQGLASAVVVAPRDARGPRVGPGARQPYRQGPPGPLVAADVTAAVLGALAYAAGTRSGTAATLLVGALLTMTVGALNARGGLYRPARLPRVLDELPALGGRVAVAWCVTLTCVTALPGAGGGPGHAAVDAGQFFASAGQLAPLAPGALLTACAAHCALSVGGRALVYWRRRASLLRGPRPVLVLGDGAHARGVAGALLRHPRCGVRPVGVVCAPSDTGTPGPTEPASPAGPRTANGPAASARPADPADAGVTDRPAATSGRTGTTGPTDTTGTSGTVDSATAAASAAPAAPPVPEDPGQDAPPGLPVLSTTDALHRAAIQNDVRTVLIAAGPADARERWLPTLHALGCDLWELAPAPPGPTVPVQYIAGFPCRPLTSGGRGGARLRKRALDVVVSAALLLLAAPVLLVCALLLRTLEGPGVVFRQERVGMGGRRFTLLKFRTHRPADPQEAATRWSVADEDRISPYCRFLRRTSLDELPQLWNVLRGDMSLVGPRPERPYFVDRFSQQFPDYARRHRMPVGITGLAQIHGLRGDTSIEDRCRFDNAYIDGWSFWQDLCILLRTLGCLVRHTGS